MTDLLQKNPLEPRLIDAMNALKTDIFRSLNSVKVGKINSFDQTSKTAEVQILFKRVLSDGTFQSYPVLVDCPVFTLQGGGGSIQFPILAGDQCIVLFSDRNLDIWFNSGSEQPPQSPRCHDLSDGIALVGLNPLTSTLADYDENVNLIIPETKKMVISGGDAVEALGDKLLALKDDVDNIMTYLGNLVTYLNAHVHTSAAPGNPTTAPTVPFITTPPTMVGTTKLKGS